MLTLADCSTARFQTATGFCPGSSDFLEIINDAVDGLIMRGDWSETIKPIRVNVMHGCITWPRWVGEVRKIHGCRSDVAMRNAWWEFLERKGPRCGEWCGFDHWRGGERNMEMQYKAPTYNDIYGANCYVRVYPMVGQDSGATVTLFGADTNGQPLQQEINGAWSLGVTLTVAQPFTSSTMTVSRIDRVVKSATQGNLILYAYDSVQDALFDLAVYEPSETNPSYLRYKLAGGREQCGSGCKESVIALVKLANLPIANPTDLVIINNRGALLDAVRAIKREDANDSAGARQLWGSAIEKLNRQLENDSPDDQFSAANNTWGDGRCFTNQCF